MRNLNKRKKYLLLACNISVEVFIIYLLGGLTFSFLAGRVVTQSFNNSNELTLILIIKIIKILLFLFCISFVGLNDFPVQIKEYLDELHASQKDEDSLYEVAEAIVEWLKDNSDEYQTSLAFELQNMPSTPRRILIAALSDAEAQVNNKNLLDTIGLFLESTDKLLAQSSASCLLTCGGVLGRDILQSKLSTKDLPHSQLIQGIMRLFN